MAIGRGFKSFVDKANRTFKHVESAAKRGNKVVQEQVKSVANADALARKAANTLRNAEADVNNYIKTYNTGLCWN